ncbi:Phosphotransferase enzyme family protein [compost metagenome]
MSNPEVLAAQVARSLQALVRRLPGGTGTVADVRRLSGGANQAIWSFDLLQDSGPVGLILRCDHGVVSSTSSCIGLDDEARVLMRAEAGGVPVPQVHCILEPADGLGRGFIMSRLAGETLGAKIVRDPSLAGARERLAWQCGEALARIHRIPLDGLPALRVAPAREELETFEQRHRQRGTVKPVFSLAFQWLRRQAPALDGPPVLVHGDFRNGNLMVDENGLRAVLDWELVHLGDPMEDLGWLCVNSWRFGEPDKPVGGFGLREELFDGYRAGGGVVDAGRVRYWEMLGTLKWGIGCQTMARIGEPDAPRSVERAAIGRRSSETEIDLMQLFASVRG